MATQTSLVAQQVRLQQWAEQIRDCQSRPKRMDVETWCAQNNLQKQTITTVFVVSVKYVWSRYKGRLLLLL